MNFIQIQRKDIAFFPKKRVEFVHAVVKANKRIHCTVKEYTDVYRILEKKDRKERRKAEKKAAPKTVYKLPLTLKSVAGDLMMTEGTGTEEEVKQFLAEQGPFFAICDVSKKDDAYLCRPKNHEGVEKGTISVDGMQVFFGAEAVDVTALTGEVDLTNLFEYVLKSKGLSGLKLTLFKNETMLCSFRQNLLQSPYRLKIQKRSWY